MLAYDWTRHLGKLHRLQASVRLRVSHAHVAHNLVLIWNLSLAIEGSHKLFLLGRVSECVRIVQSR